ncbi:MAG: AI-2E family transporter [Propionibacteriaceae bacterium]|nr:AI-2E family transporter [Propionibacteriaceae bacterium]
MTTTQPCDDPVGGPGSSHRTVSEPAAPEQPPRRRRYLGWLERRPSEVDDVAPMDDDDLLVNPDVPVSAEATVPRALRVSAAWGWRILVVVAVLALVGLLCAYLAEVVMPLFCAFLLTAALEPLNHWLIGKRWPAWAAATACLLFLIVVVGGLLTLVGVQIGAQASDLGAQLVKGFNDLVAWLGTGRWHISQDQISAWTSHLMSMLQERSDSIAGMVAAAGTTLGHFLTGLVMCLFALFFFLKDGRRFARTVIGWMPGSVRVRVAPAVRSGWLSMVSYVKAAVIVAAVDGAGAGLGAAILGSNLWVAIMALTFVCAFVPMVGALTAGAVGVIVVLATLGWVKALIMLAVFILVLEGEVHIMQPLLLSRAVNIHPLVVLVSIAIGIVIAGIPGGVFAIPLVAMANGIIREMARHREPVRPSVTPNVDP